MYMAVMVPVKRPTTPTAVRLSDRTITHNRMNLSPKMNRSTRPNRRSNQLVLMPACEAGDFFLRTREKKALVFPAKHFYFY